MTSGSYCIETNEVHELAAGYSTYKTKFEEAIADLCTSFDKVVNLNTFQGIAAQSAKSYFQEVHCTLTDSLIRLVSQLESDYGKEYSQGFFEMPVNAGMGACLPEEGLKEVENKLSSLLEKELTEASQYVGRAVSCLPSGVSLSSPNQESVDIAFQIQISQIKKIREGARRLEDSGYATFADTEGAFADMEQALRAAIGACAKGSVSIGSYTPGGFSSIIASTGLRSAYLKCVNDQAINRDKVMQNRSKCFDRESIRIKEEEAKALEQKKIACLFGTIFSVAVFVASAAALIATAGAATPLLFALQATVAGAGALSAASDIVDRVSQTSKVMSGKDILADKKSSKNEPLDTLTGIGKNMEAVVSFEGNYRSKAPDRIVKMGEDIDDLGDKVVETVIDTAVDKISENIGGESGAFFQGLYEVSKEGLDQVIISREIKVTGMVGALGSAGTVISDYYADEADKELEDLNKRSRMLESMRESSKSDPPQPRSSMW